MSDFMVVGFQKSYKNMDLNLFKQNHQEYQDLLGLIEIAEFNQGFAIKKVCVPTKKGTKITYEAIKTEEEYSKLYDDITTRLSRLINPNK